tara:strand:- start:260 stop:517 length:258 start_codon:yes stop_codon:yes gene_type:complete
VTYCDFPTIYAPITETATRVIRVGINIGFKVASDSSEGLAKTYLVVVCVAGSVLMIRRVRGFFGGAGGGALKVLRVGLKAKSKVL